MKVLGPVTVKESEMSSKRTDLRGVFIEVGEHESPPQGYGTTVRYVVTRNFAPTKVLTQNGRILCFEGTDGREKAGQLLKQLQ
jgi:hypothetical protein